MRAGRACLGILRPAPQAFACGQTWSAVAAATEVIGTRRTAGWRPAQADAGGAATTTSCSTACRSCRARRTTPRSTSRPSAARRSAARADARVLVGGLGMGYTLRAALDRTAPTSRVVVAELVPEVVAWNEGPLAELAGRPLDDPRTQVEVGDIVAYLRAKPRTVRRDPARHGQRPGRLHRRGATRASTRPAAWPCSEGHAATRRQARRVVGLPVPRLRARSQARGLRSQRREGQVARRQGRPPHALRRTATGRNASRGQAGAREAALTIPPIGIRHQPLTSRGPYASEAARRRSG